MKSTEISLSEGSILEKQVAYHSIHYVPWSIGIDIVEIDLKLLGPNEPLHGSQTIYLNKQNMIDTTIQQLINNDISPIQSVTLG